MNVLPDEQSLRWSEYVNAEKAGTREQKLECLNLFIASMKKIPIEQSRQWGLVYATLCSEGTYNAPIRNPLFESILFPAMVWAIAHDVPGARRRLAMLFQYALASKSCLDQLPESLRSSEALLRDELKISPNDATTSELLVKSMAANLAYTLHEIPSGVLSGTNAATISECQSLQVYLREFSELCEQFSWTDQYRQLIFDANFHYHHYQIYLATSGASSYSEYLQTATLPCDPSRDDEYLC